MTRSLAAAFLLLFGLLQLPFTFVGVSMAVGYALQGPTYFYELHRTLAEGGYPTRTEAAGAPISRSTGLEGTAALTGPDNRQEHSL